MSSIGAKIRQIRETENIGRAEFSLITGIKKETVISVEVRVGDPKSSTVEAVCRAFPQYAYWLMTGLTDEKAGHISPRD